MLLSPRYPKHTIPLRLKSILTTMSKEENLQTNKKTSTKCIYRSLIKNIFSENQLASSNADTMRENHPSILPACKGMR